MMYAFAAAGTGGHVYPALAVADALVAGGADPDGIVFFGGHRFEAHAVPAAGYDFVEVPLIALRRSLHPANLRIPLVVHRAARTMRLQMRRRGVKVLLAMGGYVTVPARYAIRGSGARMIIHEQNAVPGLANRIAARVADRVLVAFAAAATLPRSEVVGNPLRAEFDGFDRAALRSEARVRYEMPSQGPVVGVMGGSLGASVLNETAAAIAAHLPPDSGIIHLAGPTNAAALEPVAAAAPVRWTVLPFENSMVGFYAGCDLVLCRGGAVTVSELAATATPAVIVPLAIAAAGEQHANAAVLGSIGAAKVVPQAELDRVPALVTELVTTPTQLGEMAAAARRAARPDATMVIAQAMRSVADG